MTRVTAAAKRCFDLTAASAGLLGLAPVLLAIGAIIKLDSTGPVLFAQERVGRDFRPFRILKFRTMKTGVPGARITAGRDQRITRVGRVLRASKLDELPQLLNVIKGDMSLVGPRPELPEYVRLFEADYRDLLRVRPGLTDLASLLFSNEAELLGRSADPDREYTAVILPRKIELSRRYVQNVTLLGDLRLIALTALRVAGVQTGVEAAGATSGSSQDRRDL